MLDFNEREKKLVNDRLANMTAHIINQTHVRNELESRTEDPHALYFHGYEMKPDFLKLGDGVFTKYGDHGEVVSIDAESYRFTLKNENGDLVTEGVDRISSLQYGNFE